MTDTTYNALFICTGNSAAPSSPKACSTNWAKAASMLFRRQSPKARFTRWRSPRWSGCARDNGLPQQSWDEFVKPDAPVFDSHLHRLRQRRRRGSVGAGQARVGVRLTRPPLKAPMSSSAFFDAAITLRRRIELFLSLPLQRPRCHVVTARAATSATSEANAMTPETASHAAAAAMEQLRAIPSVGGGVHRRRYRPGQFAPDVQAIGRMEIAQVNLPVGLLIWMICRCC